MGPAIGQATEVDGPENEITWKVETQLDIKMETRRHAKAGI